MVVAHRSGGPRRDVVEPAPASRTGFLAAEPDEYARAVLEVIALAPDERARIVDAARYARGFHNNSSVICDVTRQPNLRNTSHRVA